MNNKTRISKKLTIVFLDFDDIKNPLLGAGQARATLEVGKRLIKKGHKVTVISSRYPGYKDRTENGITYKHIGLGSGNIRLNNLVYILALPFAVKKIRADIIIECFTAPISTLFSPLWTEIPVVALPSTFDADRFTKLYHLPFNRIEEFGLRFYKYFLPYTEYLDKKMRQVNPEIISKIVPEGVSNEFFKIKKKEPKYILFLGRLDVTQKGIDLLLKAYSKIANDIKYPLVIAGNGPDEDKVKSMIRQLKLDGKVKMLGATYGEKKNKVLSEALFVAFPSRNETFSLFALEALASGLPLVAFEIPGLSWNNDKVALKARPYSIDSYAHVLKKSTDRITIKKMSTQARLFAKGFSWDKVAEEFESFFKEITERKAPYV